MIGPSLLSLLLVSGCGGAVEVRLAADKTLDVEAKGATLGSVLECLADRVGFKLVVESVAALRQPVTMSLRGQTSTQTVVRVLEGLLVNYAFATDITGSRISTLLLTARSSSASSSGSPAGPVGVNSFPGNPLARRPVTNTPPPEPEIEPQSENQAPPAPPPPTGLVPPYPAVPFYPEARPLTPLSLRDSRQIQPWEPRPSRSPAGTNALGTRD